MILARQPIAQMGQLPRYCPESAALTQAFAQRQTVRLSGALLSSAQMDKCLRCLQVVAALLPCFAPERTALPLALRQPVQTAELPPHLLESAVRIPTCATRNGNVRPKKNSANLSFAPTENLPLCRRANAAPRGTSVHCSTARAYLALQRDASPETWLPSHETLAVRAKLSATTPTVPRFVALLNAAVTAQ